MSIGLGMFRSRSAPSPSSSDTEEGTASSYKKLLSRTLTNPVRTMRNMVELDEDEETEDGEQQQGDNQTGNLMTRSIRRKFWSKARPPNPMNLLKLVEGHLTLESDSTGTSMSDSQEQEFAELEKKELPLPDLVGVSEVLNDDHRRSLVKELPARAQGYPWTLLYSTSKHGFSLKTLYREMVKVDTPVLLIVQDTKGMVFGAVTSNSIHLSDLFYGTGETFLFTFHPEFLCFPWTGNNEFFIKGDTDSLAIGAGDGHFGLWLDGDLYHGRSYPCNTFANLRLNSEDDFVVKHLECWGFV